MPTNIEIAILNRMIDRLSSKAARALLTVIFPKDDLERINALADKARSGELTSAEDEELNSYIRVGHWLGQIHSRARLALVDAVG